jgi:hypothetical protein
MDVFLVPLGANRYELYCEPAHPPPSTDSASGESLKSKATRAFGKLLAEGEEARRSAAAGEQAPSGKLRRWATRKFAEAVAEQRLLWHVRGQTAIRLVHPDDLDGPSAMAISRAQLQIDYEKHRRWTGIDSLLTIGSVPFVLVPGPNVIGYYFLFRTVGHYLSMRGASQGLGGVTWEPVASSELTRLRGAFGLAPEARTARVEEIARVLGLERLGAFVEDAAGSS